MRMENKKIKPIIILILIFVILIIYSTISSLDEIKELKKYGTIVDAEVRFIRPTRGKYDVDVKFKYQNQWYENDVGIGNVDGLKIGSKIKILISSRKPDGVMRYLYTKK